MIRVQKVSASIFKGYSAALNVDAKRGYSAALNVDSLTLNEVNLEKFNKMTRRLGAPR